MNKFEDLLQRFEGLLNRFEGTESAPSTGSAKAVEATEAPSTSLAPAAPRLPKPIKDFDAAVEESLNKFLDIGNGHTSKVIQGFTLVVKDQFKLMRDLIHAICTSKKEIPADIVAEITPIYKALDDRVFKLGKDLNFKNHSKVIQDGLQLINLLVMEDPIEIGKEYLDQMDFFGNKILTSQVQPDCDWYRSFRREICQKFYEFLVATYHNGIPFKLDGGNFKESFKLFREATSTDDKPKEEKKAEVKEEVKAPKPAEKAKPAEKGKPAARPKLPPTKVKRGKMWDISGFEGETIEFQEKEVDMSTSFTK